VCPDVSENRKTLYMKKLSYFKTAIVLVGLAAPCCTGDENKKNNYLFLNSVFLFPFLFSEINPVSDLQKPTTSDLYNFPFALNLNEPVLFVNDLPTGNAAMYREDFHLHEFNFFKFEMLLNYFKLRKLRKPKKPQTKRIFNRKRYRYMN
jgi:hypothetical protein